jgi:hypothetical protein
MIEPKVAVAASQRTRLALDRWITSSEGRSTMAAFDARQLYDLVAMAGIDQSASRSWESAAQFYLASIAASGQWRERSSQPGTVLETARRLRESLLFGDGTATPQSRFDKDGPASPGQQSLTSHWQSLQKTVSIVRPQGQK